MLVHALVLEPQLVLVPQLVLALVPQLVQH